MNRLERLLALTSFLMVLLLINLIMLTFGSCTSHRTMSCPPPPTMKGRVKQKLPQPHFPFTRKPFKV